MKKKKIRFILLSLMLNSAITSINPTTVFAQRKNKDEINVAKSYNKLRKIDQTLSQKLYLKKQTNNHDWSKFVKNLRLLKNNQIEIYVNDNFLKLKESQRENVVNQAQLFTIRTTDCFKDFDQTTYLDGLATVVFCNGSYLGRSKYLSNKELIWYN